MHQGGRLRGQARFPSKRPRICSYGQEELHSEGLEAWFTLLIEVLWPKERILEVYLNIIEFGPGIWRWGSQSNLLSQARQNLTRYEAALLAAVLPNPLMLKASTPHPIFGASSLDSAPNAAIGREGGW